MSKELLLFLADGEDQPISWFLRDLAANRVIEAGVVANAAALTELTALADREECYAITPLCHTTWLEVKVPNHNKETLKAIPYQLEEQLCDDIDTLHFALGPKQQDDRYPVAVTAKERIQAWIRWLDNAGIRPKALIPETLKPSTEPGEIVALQWGQRTVTQLTPFRGVSWDNNQLEQWLALAKEGFSSVKLYREETSATDTDPELEAMVDIQTITRHQAALLYQTNNALDLLQGEFQRVDHRQSAINAWRWPVALIIALLIGYPAALHWQNSQLEQQKANVVEQINSLYRTTFPESKRIVNVRSQTTQRLRELRQRAQGNPLLAILDNLAPALNRLPSLQLLSLDFNATPARLQIQVEAPEKELIERLRMALENRGMKSKILSNRQGASNQEATLQVMEYSE